MANYVKISIIGASALRVDPDTPPTQIVHKMIEYLVGKLDQVLPDQPDLIVLPEVCDRPADYPAQKQKDYYAARGEQVMRVLADKARENNCYIAYPAVRHVPEDDVWLNSTVMLDRKGEVAGIYNKNHVTVTEYEEHGVAYADGAPLIQCDFGRVACVICFDLNFDSLRSKYIQARPDLVVFSSMYHGGLMQSYWAYSCRCHFVAAVCGLPSAIISPVGEILATTTNYTDSVTATVNLDCCLAHFDYNWDKFRAAKAKYGPKIDIFDPGLLGSVLISSTTDEFTVYDVVKEFEIELLDDYFARALDHRRQKLAAGS